MSIRTLFLFICFSSLFACSSSGGRAPVSDLFSSNTKSNKTTVYSTPTPDIKKGQKHYTVQKGDTLYSIGWKSGVDVSELIKQNNLKSPFIIKIGQVLKLSADTVQVSKKKKSKSDLASQNNNKNSNSACIAQNCQKNTTKTIAPEKTKAYPAKQADKKSTVTEEKTTNSQKISSWLWPSKGKLTKKFSSSPTGLQGISIVNERGSSIHAAAAGQVVYAGSGLRGYGNLIIIKHNFDYLSAYAHNEKLLVRENETIKKGQKIATMGDSGTGYVHLHFEIRYRGKSVDPLRYLPKK